MVSLSVSIPMLLVLAASCALVRATAEGSVDIEIFVSPDGNDTAGGAGLEPVATLHRAQLLARTALASGQSARITLMGGVHRLDHTLVFTPEDSGIANSPALWQSSPGENAIIRGSVQLKLKWKPHRDGILKADTPADLVMDQLFVNGAPQHMARYPNYDPDQRIMNGYAADCISNERAARGSIRPMDIYTRPTRICGVIIITASQAKPRTAPCCSMGPAPAASRAA